jgi:hypothetical protein
MSTDLIIPDVDEVQPETFPALPEAPEPAEVNPAYRRANVFAIVHSGVTLSDVRHRQRLSQVVVGDVAWVLHCLPGTIRTKAVVFDHLKSLLNPSGVHFGATLLGGGVEPGRAARRAMSYFNAKLVFTNRDDDPVGLRDELAQRFAETSLRVVGCIALFAGRA